MTTNVETKVIDIVAEQLGFDKKDIKKNMSFVEDLNADSLDQTELVMSIEEEFNIEVAEDKAEKLKTVQDLIDFVSAAQKK